MADFGDDSMDVMELRCSRCESSNGSHEVRDKHLLSGGGGGLVYFYLSHQIYMTPQPVSPDTSFSDPPQIGDKKVVVSPLTRKHTYTHTH